MWWAAPVTDDRRRTATEHRSAGDELPDDDEWEAVSVPGHWQRSEAYADLEDNLLYRRDFTTDSTTEGADPARRRRWLTLDGVFYQSDVWIDGSYLGDTEGWFFPHSFEVTEQLATGNDHSVTVEVSCRTPSDRTAKRSLTGVFQHWDALDDTKNPGGIWGPVTIRDTGPVAILHSRVLCTQADAASATVSCRLVLDAVEAGTVRIRTRLCEVEHHQDIDLAAGENRTEWTMEIRNPELWWPRALGEPTQHDLTIDVLELDGRHGEGAPSDGMQSDGMTRRIGLRSITMRNWIVSVNGERLFLKGANLAPTTRWPAETTAAEVDRDVSLALDAGLDLLRVHAHVAHPHLYDAADAAGLLIWQDMPLQWGYHRSVRAQANRQARELVDLLGHHPSVAIWCGHNEPMAISIDAETLGDRAAMARLGARVMVDQQLPTFNRTVLDRGIARVLRRHDGTRPVVPHSGVLPNLPTLDGTDAHWYFGWYHGDERQFAALARTLPRQTRFVTEFGAQAVPVDASFIDSSAWPDLDWEHLATHHCLQHTQFERYVPPSAYATYEDWVEATQRYQADVLRFHIETIRRSKYSPAGGFAMFMFADCEAGVTWSVLDVNRVPKLGYQALADVCRPVIAVADRLPEEVFIGEHHHIDLHVISDLRRPVDAELRARWTWDGRTTERRFASTVPPDSVSWVAMLHLDVPQAEGPLTLDIDLTVDGVTTSRTDQTMVRNDPTRRER